MRKSAVLALALALCVVTGPDAVAGEPGAPVLPPAFTLPGLDGKPHGLGEWRNKVVLLNFWASWCSPCQSEIPDLVAFQNQYSGQGLQVVGIGMDDEVKLRNVHRTLGINYPVLFTNSPAHPLLSRFGNHTGVVPYTVLVSRAGEVVYTHTGVITRELFEEWVIPLLQ